MRFAVLVLALALSACSPASWQAQRLSADTVADVANTQLIPIVAKAYKIALLHAVMTAESELDAQMRVDVVKRQWGPAWNALDAFAAAHAAWSETIENEGDPVATAEAARKAYCDLQTAVIGLGVNLPKMPILECAK